MALDKNSVAALTSAVFDNGRRGGPRPGCDCEQCFGYCLVDNDEAMRRRFQAGDFQRPAQSAPLDFD